MRNLVVLLTDFGLKDHYVGVMKGVILSIAPQACIIDLSHEISPQNIMEGAYVLGVSYRYFPRGSIFVGVVDPGVGTSRRGICVEAGGYFFVGPDNGLFTLIYQKNSSYRVFSLQEGRFFRSKVSNTFHGRDIFAPVAAHLVRTRQPEEFGPEVRDPVMLPWLWPKHTDKGIRGRIIYVDRFGNLITNICEKDLKGRRIKGVLFKDHLLPFCKTYAEQHKGAPVCLIGSDGYLEIAISQGSALERWGREGEVYVLWA